jgi:hypothetical protein
MNNVKNELVNSGRYSTYYDKLVGDDVVNTINTLNNTSDVNNPTIITSSEKYLVDIIGFVNIYSTLNTNLSNLDISLTDKDVFSDKSYINFVFENEAFFDDLKKLATITKDWNRITNVLARVVGTSNTKLEILSLRRGSMIMQLIPDHDILLALIALGKSALDVVKEKLKTKNLQLEVEKASYSNKELIICELEKNLKTPPEVQAEAIANNLIKDFFKEDTNTSSKEATYNELIVAGVIALKYFKKGLRLEPILLDPTDEEKELIKSLNASNSEVNEQRKLLENYSNNTFLLEGHSPDEEDAEILIENNSTISKPEPPVQDDGSNSTQEDNKDENLNPSE